MCLATSIFAYGGCSQLSELAMYLTAPLGAQSHRPEFNKDTTTLINSHQNTLRGYTGGDGAQDRDCR